MSQPRTSMLALTLVPALAIGGTLLPAAAWSQPPGGGPMTFQQLDTNGDGVVTEQELATARAERMAQRAAQGAPMRGAANAPAFSDLDLNGDGRLSPDEFAAHRAAMPGRPGMGPGMGPGPGAGAGPMGQAGGVRPGMGMQAPSFSEFDLNGDGGLTEQEFYDARAKRMRERAQQGYPMYGASNAPTFQQIDSDGNGVATPAEFAGGQAAHRQRMMGSPAGQPPAINTQQPAPGSPQ